MKSYARQYLKRKLYPGDVAKFAVFLASDEASGCTNQHLRRWRLGLAKLRRWDRSTRVPDARKLQADEYLAILMPELIAASQSGQRNICSICRLRRSGSEVGPMWLRF